MSDASDMITRAREIRLRLRHPANAVFDDGINLKRRRLSSKPKVCALPVAIAHYIPMPILVRTTVTVGSIIRAVAKYYGNITPRDIRGPSRRAFVVKARHMVFYLASSHCKLSTTLIGSLSGGRDHSTVIHGRDAIREKVVACDLEILRAITDLEQILYAGLDHHKSSIPTLGQCDLAQPEREGLQEQAIQSLAQGGAAAVAAAETKTLPESLAGLLHTGGVVLPAGQEGERPG